MKELIYGDLYRYMAKTDRRSLLKCLKIFPGFRYTFFMRLSTHYGKRSIIGVISRFYVKKYSFKFGLQIPAVAKIGKGLMLAHFGGIVVNSKAVIGDNCNLLQNVTIGRTHRGKLNGAPTIGNQVYIGPGAVIVGKIFIGDNVLIAPNAYVNFDVPSNCIVIGNPAKIINNDNAVEGYITNIVT